MDKIKITSDSVCDLPASLLKHHNIDIIPLIVSLGDAQEEDVGGLPEKIYDFVAKTKSTPKTSARSAKEYQDFFTKHKPEGGSLIHFSISAELSVSNQNAEAAAKQMENVFVIDTRSLSTGIGILVMNAVQLADEGIPAEEIVKIIEERKQHVQCSFVVKDLTYLHRGGRCSGTSRLFAAVLMLKPQILVENGKMAPGKKYMGTFDHCLKKYVNDILEKYNNPDLDYCFVTHTKMDNPKLVEETIAAVKAKYPFKNIIETIAGGTITAHCGKDTLGVIYYNK
jgi:DegV family protein with EDD domain